MYTRLYCRTNGSFHNGQLLDESFSKQVEKTGCYFSTVISLSWGKKFQRIELHCTYSLPHLKSLSLGIYSASSLLWLSVVLKE